MTKLESQIDHDESILTTVDYLKSIFIDATETIRHYDNQRATFTQIFASLLTVFLSAITAATHHGTVLALLPIASFVSTALSVSSVIAVLKLNLLIRLQRARAVAAMTEVQRLVETCDFLALGEEAKRRTEADLLSSVRMGQIWLGIFIILLVGNIGALAYVVYQRALGAFP